MFPQIIGDEFICQGGTTTISADDDYTSYIWSTGAITKDLLVTTTGTYRLIITNAAGCTGEASIDIAEAEFLQPNITGATTFCSGASTILGLDTSYTSYIWSTGAITESIEVTEGTYTVTISNVEGCTGTAQVQIEEQSVFKPSITAQDSAMCAAGFNSLTAQEGFASYAWEAVNNNNNLSPFSTIFITQPDTYILTVTDTIGCRGIDSIVIAEYEAVKLAPGATKAFCSGDTIATELSLGGFPEYEWSTGDTTESIKVETGGIYMVTVTNEFGCIGTTFFEVIEHQPPIVNINNAEDSILNLCVGEATILFGVIDTGSEYIWENENGDKIGSSPVLNVDKPGIYSLMVEDKVTGCETTESTQITALENPVVLNIDTTARHLDCENRVTILDASTSENIDTFTWERLEDLATFRLNPGFDISTFEATNAGIYRVIVQNEETSCRDTAMITVTESIDTLLPNIIDRGAINVEGALDLCQGGVTQIEVERDTFQTYEWDTGATTRSLNDITEARTYTVTVTDSRSCTGSTSREIRTKFPEEIQVEIASDISEICEGEQVSINFNILSGGVGPFDISYSDGSTTGRLGNITENVGTELATPNGDSRYEILDIVDQGNNCYTANSIDTAFLVFNIQERPVANAISEALCAGTDADDATFDLTKFTDKVNGGSNLPVNWYANENLDSNITNISDFLTASKTIYATVVSNACESNPVPATLMVDNCANSLEFTHESGTALDLSILDGDDREVYITNRWGDLVFASTDYEGFENKFIGTDLPQGAYYIYIKNTEKGLPVPYKGVIYLLKTQ